jgi:prepilin-type N-terminal cleavage/methylation domain-containing protein
MNRSNKGFTLIELIVVVIIIAILAAISVPVMENRQLGVRRFLGGRPGTTKILKGR